MTDTRTAALSLAETDRWTERRVLDLLRARHSKDRGNGPEWAFMEHVRDAAGFDAGRTIDALALHLWPSRGHELHAFEVKISRSDLQRELRDPEKAAAWGRVVDRFWLVCAPGVAKGDDVPKPYGLLVVNDSGSALRVAKPAPQLFPPKRDIDRSLLACMLRSAARGAPDD